MLERPFVPIRKANQLSSFMVARNDGSNYGKLILYQAPDQSNAVSPARAASLIEADPNISAKFSLLDQLRFEGAARRRAADSDGRLDLLRPARSTWRARASSPLPRFNYVAVTYGERAVLDLRRARRGRPPPRRHDPAGRADGQHATGERAEREHHPDHDHDAQLDADLDRDLAAARERHGGAAARAGQHRCSPRPTPRSPTRTSRPTPRT